MFNLNDEVSCIHINSLPTEILIKIFSFLNLNQKINCENVCKYWQKIVYTNQKDLFFLENNLKYDYLIEKNSIYFHCDRELKISNLISKCGKYLRRLHLEGISFKSNNLNSTNIMKTIIDNCSNINYLNLGKCKDIDFNNFNLLLDKYGCQLTYFRYKKLEYFNFVEILVNKLNSNIITSLGIDIPDQRSLNLICSKLNNLENVEIFFFFPLDFQKLCLLKKLKVLKLCNRQFNFNIIEVLFRSNIILDNLKSLNLNSVVIDKHIISNLHKMVNLKFLKLVISHNDELNRLFSNMKNLFSLSINLQIYPSIDNLNNLYKLTNLENLEIKCQNIDILKFNFDFVMPKLKCLTLKGISYRRSFINKENFLIKLPFIFPNLIKLVLTDQWEFSKYFPQCLNLFKRLKYFKLYTSEYSRNKALKQFIDFKNSIKIIIVLCKIRVYSDSIFSQNYCVLIPLYAESLFDN